MIHAFSPPSIVTNCLPPKLGYLLMKYLSIQIQNKLELPLNHHCKIEKLLLVSFILNVIWRATSEPMAIPDHYSE